MLQKLIQAQAYHIQTAEAKQSVMACFIAAVRLLRQLFPR